MTASRDPDRLVRAWLDLMPSEAPDRVIDSVLQAVEAAPQVRRPLGAAIRRPFQMNRFSLTAIAAVLALLIAGGAVFLSASKPQFGGASPTPSAGPSATPLVSGMGRGLGYAAPISASLRGDWVARNDASSGLDPSGKQLRLSISDDGNTASVKVDGATARYFAGQPVTATPDSVWLVTVGVASGCKQGDFGQYGEQLSADGVTLTLTATADQCSARSAAFARTWTRALDLGSRGGRGVMAQFTPTFLVTLPAASFTANSGTDAVNVYAASIDRTFIAVKDPTGWTQPCSKTGGAQKMLPTNSAAFAAYLATIPGFTVQSEAMQIDGRPAVRLTVPTAPAAGCDSAALTSGQVIEWGTDVPGDTGKWFISQGDTDVLYLVDVGKDVYLLQWLGTNVNETEERGVMATVHFIDALPG